MTGCTSPLDWRLIGAVLFGLLMFGIAFNALVHALGARKDGYTSLLVVAGVIVTQIGVALICWQAALVSMAAFSASGLPMVIGEVYRSMRKREEILASLREGRDG